MIISRARAGAYRRIIVSDIPVLNKKFTATLQNSPSKGGWTYVTMSSSVQLFGTHDLLKVRGNIDGHPFRSAFIPMGDGTPKLLVKADVRTAIGKESDKNVTACLQERIKD